MHGPGILSGKRSLKSVCYVLKVVFLCWKIMPVLNIRYHKFRGFCVLYCLQFQVMV